MSLDTINEVLHTVVVNQEGQYSIWPVSKELPLGWTSTGAPGTREACLAHIDQVWSDMRPLSLRTVPNAA
ncbi:MbtH family protein [Pseudoduganella namucuonensis]|uniref:MbtH protein n=1 Tax=Pseudoduganella namucuonensis TaxID=1035707 RepID=A0A1I7LXK3_9BURK|nr:MbtH family NRPS accessory protein [Pseudoduganella namucuonensis]SFV14422.1 MbtH protein [Pseudoduganella namucuonensis]